MTYLFPDGVQLIFCKAPVAGQVKTRLLPALDAEQAAELHRRLSRFTLQRALRDRLCPVQLWCAPDTRHAFFRQCARDYPLTLHRQTGSDLGERMHHAFAAALTHYRYAILTGCDCPSLRTEDIERAVSSLQNGCDAVVAPAEDGGYVLIGLKVPCPELFEHIPWGSEKVMELTRRKLISLSLVFDELPLQWDIDNPQDLHRLNASNRGLLQTAF
ncbi:MAG: TIGR04282 family arsenosugar biosynthesis glycosyltransferase [Gammaproteobacteria bacterium]